MLHFVVGAKENTLPMYVCVCLGVTELEVAAVIQGGALAREDVTLACGAGGGCGACRQMIEEMIEDHLEACARPCGADADIDRSGEYRIAATPAAAPATALVPDRALLRKIG